MVFSVLSASPRARTKPGATVSQLMVASTLPVASIGASAPGSSLSSLTLAGSMPLRSSSSGQTTLEAEKVGVATVLPTMSLKLSMPEPSVVKKASGCLL